MSSIQTALRPSSLIPLAFLALAACESRGRDCARWGPAAGESADCRVPGWDDRAYTVHLPEDWSADGTTPVVMVLHGGASRRSGAASMTCPSGESDEAGCMHALGRREGFAVVYPSGTASRVRALRTWNAGGGIDGWQCVSNPACEEGVDDVAYFGDLLDELDGWMVPDKERIYATGLSNGAAMSHRLACELSERVAAVAPVGGANQLGAAQGCEPSRPVAVFQIHGTADPCWEYEGGSGACAQDDGTNKAAVEDSVAAWVETNACETEPGSEDLPDSADDGTTTAVRTWTGCEDDVQVRLARIEGGGHTWPDGVQYNEPEEIGPVERDWNGSEVVWSFFQEFSLPD